MKQEKIDKILEKADIAVKSGKFGQAVSSLKKINGTSSLRTYQSMSLEVMALVQNNKHAQALDSLSKMQLMKLTKEEKIDTWANKGKIERILGQESYAIVSLEKSVDLDNSIHNANTMLVLCELYQESRNFLKLEKLVEKLKGWKDYFAPAQFQLILSAKKRQNKELVVSYVRHLASHFRYIEERYIFGSLEALFLVGSIDDAASLLDKVESYIGKKNWLIYQRAVYHSEKKNYELVVDLLSDELIESMPEWVKLAEIYRLKANAYDKLKQFDLAFQNYSAMANLVKGQSSQLKFVDYAERYQTWPLKTLPDSDELHSNAPVFMVGFPRSGTTLLDSIIETQDNVVTLSETESILSVRRAFKDKLNKVYPKDLKNLSKSEINILRGVYYDFLSSLQIKVDDKTMIIDKMPLNMIHLPLILTLFPKAKIIFSLRHPLDVCLSNFQQNFQINMEMYHLIGLDDCVNRYKQVFNLFDIYQRDLNPDILYVRYEDLITDLPSQARIIFDYLNIENNDKYMEFHKLARTKVINTPSNKQVTQALYLTAKYKWKNYRKHMEPHIPELRKLLNKFEYNDSSVGEK